MKIRSRGSRHGYRSIPGFFSVALITVGIALSGCNKRSAPGATASQPRTSATHVEVGTDAVRVQTPASEFVLLPNGYLQASLAGDSGLRTLDDPSNRQAQQLAVA